jgi:DNA-binding response OmpR family regulator
MPSGGPAVRILVVEDEYLVATLLQDQLAAMGYKDVILAGDLAAGRRLIENDHPDFVILDVNVGEAKVFAIATELRAREVPFIFSTGESRDSLPVEWREYPLLEKPMRPSELSAALRTYAPKPDT